MFKSKSGAVQAERRPIMRDYAVLVLGMSAAIVATLAVIGGTVIGICGSSTRQFSFVYLQSVRKAQFCRSGSEWFRLTGIR